MIFRGKERESPKKFFVDRMYAHIAPKTETSPRKMWISPSKSGIIVDNFGENVDFINREGELPAAREGGGKPGRSGDNVRRKTTESPPFPPRIAAIIAGTEGGEMTVYFEYAFAENFLLDGLLLYLALRCARVKVRPVRLVLASATGGGEALLFPFLALPAWCALFVKLLGGVLLALIAVKGTWRDTLIAAAAFFTLTFVLGGLLVAVYSFAGVAYEEGEGYLVESAPVGLVLGCAGCLLLACVSGAKRIVKRVRLKRGLVSCRVTAGGRSRSVTGFCDSGNLLFFRGKPVCVLSATAALGIFGGTAPVGRMKLSTVSGSRESPVFVCDELELLPSGGKHKGVYFTVGEVGSGEYTVILHSALSEG